MVSFELQQIVLAYIERRITVAELEDWLVPRLPTYLGSGRDPASELVSGIELGLAELGDGLITEDEFRANLARLLRRCRAGFVATGPSETTTTSLAKVHRHWATVAPEVASFTVLSLR